MARLIAPVKPAIEMGISIGDRIQRVAISLEGVEGNIRNKLYFTQVKCTGTLFDNLCSGKVTLSCTHSSTVLPGLPNFHLWLTPLTPESENLR